MQPQGRPWARPSADVLENARERFSRLLGIEGVQAEGPLFAEFHDPFEGPDPVGHQPSLVVQPASVEEVQAVLRLATELGVHLWTSSMGRNFGYGGSAPVVDGGVVLNLRRMNRVLEIDVAQGYALIEPGVSFAQLYATLREQNAPLMMSVPDLGWGSIIGNALEHGYGYNVMGDHASAICGMEAVLADGTLLRTGQGGLPGSPLWACHRRGYGPSLDSLFMQSNFGVVTKAGLWLMPRPEIFVTGTITCRGEDDIVPLVDTIRGLLREGVLQGVPMIVGTPDEAEADEAGLGRFTLANLKQVLRPGRWSVRLGLYGDARMVAARRAILESAVAALSGAELELRTYPGDVGPETVEPRDLIPAGIPNQVLLERLKGVFGETLGHMDFSPVVPLTGEAAQRVDRLVRETMARYGLIAPVGFLLNQRSMVSACMVMFDASDAARVQLAREAVREMYDRIAEWGCAPYRSHICLADHVAGKFSFNGHALGQTYSRIKDALDPAGILSPGNHGIWPGFRASEAG
ncbi:FAD-binding oxidoreductase [Erythrobacter sp. SG61-1L]|uniref:FAD-binding oxidoreductase n=1 Tax=Erythrobacter sp. SG61-1L TaxID=1603897 RepID=UPI000A61A475|nr:FAD-binding oxidoreductase [Erythrobacter sp. SG61-1L]